MAKGHEDIEAVRARGLVPTEREHAEGVRQDQYTFERPAADEPRRPLGQTLKGYVADLDPRRIGGPKLPLTLLGLAALFGAWDDIALAVLTPEIRAEFGFSFAFVGTLTVMLSFIDVLFAPAMGYLADRVKRVWMLRIGNLALNVGSVVTGAAPGVPLVVGGRMISGVGKAISDPAGFPLLTDYYPLRSRARVFAFLSFAGGLGLLIGPSVAGSLGDLFGWRFAVIGLGLLATLVTLGYFFLQEPVRGAQDRRAAGADEEAAQREQRPVSWGEAWRAAGSIVTLRRIWYAVPALTVAGTATPVFLTLYYAEEFGLGPTQRGAISSVTSGVALAGVLFAGPAGDRLMAYRPGRIMAAFGGLLFVYSASIALLVISGNLWLSIAVSLPLGFGTAVILPALFALISVVVPARIRGLGLQTIAPWQLVGLILVQIIIGLADSWGLRGAMLLLIPVFVIGGLILASAAAGVDRDIRAALAAAMADEAVREARAAGGNKMLVCRDIDVTYSGVQVLFNVDFDVDEGEIVAVMGTNGAGKSTLLRAIAGIQEASNGAIFLDGQDITHVPPHENARNGIVMVPGGHAIFPTLSVDENLRTAAWMYRDDDTYVRTKMEEVLNFFPVLRERIHQPAGNLSGGEQQMIALGQAFLMRPRLLMIDELSLGLAPQIVEQLLDTLRAIHAQGTTVLLVEQSLNVAVTIAERAVFMEKGEIRFDGATAELLRRPELVRAVFMGGAAGGPGSISTGGPARQVRAADERERILLVEDIHVSFGGVQALRGAGVEVLAGQVVGVIGPNGAGKTTLFDVVSGYVQPDRGRVVVEASDVTTLRPDARAFLGLGRSFQNARLFPSMTVRENIAVALERHLEARNPILAAVWAPQVRTTERRVRRRVDTLVQLLGLGAYADKFVSELSTGTRRAVDIALVMAAEPRILLLDEPSSGLAQAESEELGPVLLRLVRDTGCGLLVIEHDIPLIASISERLLAMELGEVVASGPPHDVLTDDRVVASYLAASSDAVTRSGTQDLAAILGLSKNPKKR